MWHCASLFLVLTLAAASAHVLAATELSATEELLQQQARLQSLKSSGTSERQLLAEGITQDAQLPARSAGGSAQRRGARLRLHRRRNAAREAANAVSSERRAEDAPGSSEIELHREAAPQKLRPSKGADEKAREPGELNLLRDSDGGATEEDLARAALQGSEPSQPAADKIPQDTAGSGEAPPTAAGEARTDMPPRPPLVLDFGSDADARDNAEAATSPRDSGEPTAHAAPRDADAVKAAEGVHRAAEDPSTQGGKRDAAESLPHDGGLQDVGEGDKDLGPEEQLFLPLAPPEDDLYDSSKSEVLAERKRAAGSWSQQPPGKAGESTGSSEQKSGMPDGADAVLERSWRSSEREPAQTGGKLGRPFMQGADGARARDSGSSRGREQEGEPALNTDSKRPASRADSEARTVAKSFKLQGTLRDALKQLQSDGAEDGVWLISPDEELRDAAEKGDSRSPPPERGDGERNAEGRPSGGKDNPVSGAEKSTASRNQPAGKAGANSRQNQSTEDDAPREQGQKTEPGQVDGRAEKPASEPHAFSRMLDHLQITNILDIPCGDAQQVASKVNSFPTSRPEVIRYIGVDDAEEAISSAKSKHGDTPNFSFHQKDYVHVDLPKADLLVSRAALLRPPLLKLVDMLANFARSGTEYALLGSFKEPELGSSGGGDGASEDGAAFYLSLRHEPFNLLEPLHMFPEPEGFGAGFGEEAGPEDGDAPARQMLLYYGEYLRQQDFKEMRERAELLLSEKNEGADIASGQEQARATWGRMS